MKKVAIFVQENIRYILALIVNIIALILAIFWAIQSNWNTSEKLELEPIVTSVGLTATLLGLNFVNNKLTKPLIKVRIENAVAQDGFNGLIHGIAVTVENHSILKTFIRNFKVEIPNKKEVVQFLYDGFTRQPLNRFALEPGQAFTFHITLKNLRKAPSNPDDYGDFLVTTDIGHTFSAPAKVFRLCLSALQNSESNQNT